MRLSSLVVAVVLLVSPAVFAQHSSAGGSSSAGSSGGSSGAASHAGSSGGSSAGSSSHSSGGSASSSSHSSGGSASHSSSARSSSTGSSASHSSAQPSRANNAGAIREPNNARVQGSKTTELGKNPQPEHKGFIAFLRHPFWKHEPKAAEADLRRPICKKEPCREPEPKPPAPVESNLRQPVCKDKSCVCPPGQVHGNNGACLASVAMNNFNRCQPGQHWDGAACRSGCGATEHWNGISCVVASDECAVIRARAESLASELRGYKGRTQIACVSNPLGQECSNLTQNRDAAVLRYRSLMNEAPVNCRAALPDPLSF